MWLCIPSSGVKSPQANVTFLRPKNISLEVLISRNGTGLLLVEIDEPIDDYRYLVEYNSKNVTFRGNHQVVEAECVRNVSISFNISALNECGERSEAITREVECKCKFLPC